MSAIYHTPIAFAAAVNSSVVNTPLAALDAALVGILNGTYLFTQEAYSTGAVKTIASGAITITDSFHTVDTEASAASDDLDTINGGNSGDILYLAAANDARTVVLKHGTGNIYLNGGTDVSLDTDDKTIKLFYHNSVWSDIAFGAVPASGTLVARTELSSDGTMNISLPSANYNLAELYLELRSDYGSANYDDFFLRFNSDSTAANYENQSIYDNSAGTTINTYLGTEAGLRFVRAAGSTTSPTSYYAAHVIQIFNYRNIAAYRHVVLNGHNPASNTGADNYSVMGGGQWKNLAAAISSIQVLPVNGTNFKAGSAYMVKGY